jgi:cytidylate kinase
VGRGAQYFLGDRPDAYHVFVYAPYEEKIRRERAAGRSAADAAQLVDTVDLERSAFIKRYFARDWPDRPLYHLMLNSQMGDDSAVETIVGGIQALDKP